MEGAAAVGCQTYFLVCWFLKRYSGFVWIGFATLVTKSMIRSLTRAYRSYSTITSIFNFVVINRKQNETDTYQGKFLTKVPIKTLF